MKAFVSPRRGLRAALLICVVAGLSACTPESPHDETDPFGAAAVVRLGDAVAAEVDSTPIYVSDVRREGVTQGLVDASEPLDPGSARFNEILDDLIHRRVLALEARRRGLADTDETRRRISAAREHILYNIIVETVLDEAVTDDALRTLYEEQSVLLSLGDEIRARHIVTETYEEAQEVAQLAREGADFAQLALDYSIDEPTRLEGGDLGYFSRGEIVVEEIERAAFETEVGEVSQPFRSELGWHVLVVEDRRAEEAPTFEEMRPDLVRFLAYQELQRLSDVLSARADVRRFTGESDEADDTAPPASADDEE